MHSPRRTLGRVSWHPSKCNFCLCPLTFMVWWRAKIVEVDLTPLQHQLVVKTLEYCCSHGNNSTSYRWTWSKSMRLPSGEKGRSMVGELVPRFAMNWLCYVKWCVFLEPDRHVSSHRGPQAGPACVPYIPVLSTFGRPRTFLSSSPWGLWKFMFFLISSPSRIYKQMQRASPQTLYFFDLIRNVASGSKLVSLPSTH